MSKEDHREGRTRRAPGIILGPRTDPPSAQSTGQAKLPGSIFDQARIADAIRKGTIDWCPPLDYPNDDLLIATVVDLGMPRWSADQMRYHPGLRLAYVRVWMDVQAAAKGHAEAQERIDVVRATYQEMRQLELISERPSHTVGFWER